LTRNYNSEGKKSKTIVKQGLTLPETPQSRTLLLGTHYEQGLTLLALSLVEEPELQAEPDLYEKDRVSPC